MFAYWSEREAASIQCKKKNHFKIKCLHRKAKVLMNMRKGKFRLKKNSKIFILFLSPGDGAMANQNLVTGPSNMYFDEKQYHDEDDSMAEYGNGENGKFNEDGSFIGLYGRDRIQTYVVQYNQGQNQNDSENPGSSKPYTSFV